MRSLFDTHLKGRFLPALCAGAAIGSLGYLSQMSQIGFLVAPLGASATLIWFVPASPLARPRAVVGGSLVSAAIGLALYAVFGTSPVAIGVAVALAIFAMITLDVLHAPAGALPILVASSHPTAFSFLSTLAFATVFLVVCGALYHRFLGDTGYPTRWI
jgi:CBS-domain-containing membrane protein